MKDKPDDPLKLLRWFENQPSLEELQNMFPDDWAAAEDELAEAIRDKNHSRLDTLLRPKVPSPSQTGKRRAGLNPREARDLLRRLVRQRMAALAIERYLKMSLTSGKKQSVPTIDRLIFQYLFFDRNYGRKLVSDRAYRLLWPLVRRPNLLLPLAEAHGIYCFYSRRFIMGICELIGQRGCIEIASGDGALARFIRARGTTITAYDDYSWAGKITYPSDVVKCDAAGAVRLHDPEVVICSWPPAKNNFEQHVFRAGSVQRYIVIGSEHKFAFGNWLTYRAQRAFTMRKDADLGRLLLPREFGGAIYVFDRQNNADVSAA